MQPPGHSVTHLREEEESWQPPRMLLLLMNPQVVLFCRDLSAGFPPKQGLHSPGSREAYSRALLFLVGNPNLIREIMLVRGSLRRARGKGKEGMSPMGKDSSPHLGDAQGYPEITGHMVPAPPERPENPRGPGLNEASEPGACQLGPTCALASATRPFLLAPEAG